MRQDWDARARENARYYVATGKENWTDDEFFLSGQRAVEEQILNDLENICQGKSPSDMKVLEIGCGAGRITRALASLFGEVHAVDVSGEMIAQAQLLRVSKQRQGPDSHSRGCLRFCVLDDRVPAHSEPGRDL